MSLRSRIAALFGRGPAVPLDPDPEGMSEDPAVRRAYLTRSLDEHLEETARAAGFGPAGRVAWVAEHLEIYATRCIGFAAHAGDDAVRASSFLTVVEIGTEALRRELGASPPPPAGEAAWRAFLDRLAATRAGADFESLAAAARELRVALGGRDPWKIAQETIRGESE
jgi:hypothetical protein